MQAPIKIYLNGTLITGRIEGLDQFEVTITQEDDSTIKKTYSSELTFYDDGYTLLKAQLIDDVNAISNQVTFEAFDECCGKIVYEGIIKPTTIDWCEPICSITTNVIQKEQGYDCIQSTTVWDDKFGFLTRPRPKMRYCVGMRPEAIFYVMIFFYAIINVLAYTVLAPLLISSDWRDWLDESRDRIVGCNWYHPSAFVRDYIQNVCDICGLQFESSILNDSSSYYYNTVLFAAQVRKGYKPSQTASALIDQNLPVETVETLMRNHLMPLFNAKYWVINGKLIFERKDFFDNLGVSNVWVDTEQLYNDGLIIDDKVCYSYNDQTLYAFGTFEYALDPIDICSNEASQRFDNIVEWNPIPINPNQKGELKKQFLSSQARVVQDTIEKDPWSSLYLSPVNIIFGNQLGDYKGNIYMSQHTAANYKFLIYDTDTSYDYAKPKGLYYDTDIFTTPPPPGQFFYYDIEIDEDTGNVYPFNVTPGVRYNYPFTFFYDNGNLHNLYTDFHYIDDPRVSEYKVFNFEFEFAFDCSQLNSFDINKSVRLIKSGQVKYGEIKTVKINYFRRTISVNGVV